MKGGRKLGEILVTYGVPRAYIDLALKEQVVSRKQLGNILLEMSLVNPEVLARALAEQWGYRHFSIFTDTLQEGLDFPLDFVIENEIVPIMEENGHIEIGMVNPVNQNKLDAVKRYVKGLQKELKIAVVSSETFQRYIETKIHIPAESVQNSLSRAITEVMDGKALESSQAADALRQLLMKAIIYGASDIHIEPSLEGGKVRLRKNGDLEVFFSMNQAEYMRLLNVIRLRAEIQSSKLPQDGRIGGDFLNDKKYESIDFRISTTPTWSKDGGLDAVVIRVLDRRTSILPLKTLGMGEAVLNFISKAKNKSHGMIIFTGPTGSGKTTTIYSAMSTINCITRNVMTVEDPVEYRNFLWKQLQVNDKGSRDSEKFTFAKALRSILRQDPDIIFCGEIRDEETAKTAIDMANTGHLVFTTLHANDSIKAIPRLQSLKVQNAMIEACVLGIISQRLVKTLCPQCKKLGARDGDSFIPVGCNVCNNTGYKGRIMAAEVFPFEAKTQEAVQLALEGRMFEARKAARAAGIIDLESDMRGKIEAGLTTIEELERVI